MNEFEDLLSNDIDLDYMGILSGFPVEKIDTIDGIDIEDNSCRMISEIRTQVSSTVRSRTDNENEGNFSSMSSTPSVSTPKSFEVTEKKRRHTQVKRLTTALQGLMGEANMRFARGDVKYAQKICLEIIRQEPHASEPYKLLANIFEQDNNRAKQLQLLILAAHLDSRNVDLWLEIADLQVNLKMKHSDILKTFAKAICASPNDLKIHLERIDFIQTHFQKLNDHNRDVILLYSRLRLINTICSNFKNDNFNEFQPVLINMVDVTIQQCRDDRKNDFIPKIITTFLSLFELYKKYPVLIKYSHIDFLLNSLLKIDKLQEFFDVISYKPIFQIDFDYETTPTLKINSFCSSTTQHISTDLKTKILRLLISLNENRAIDNDCFLRQELDEYISNEDVEKNGDLFLDICESLMNNKNSKFALQFFDKLFENANFDIPAIRLRYAKCLRDSQEVVKAVQVYEQILNEFKPHDFFEVRITLFELLHEIGNVRNAAQYISDRFDTKLTAIETRQLMKLFETYFVDFSNKVNDDDIESYGHILMYLGEMILSKYFVSIENDDELRKKVDLEKSKMFTKKYLANFDVREEYLVLVNTLKVCLQCHRYDKMHYFTYLTINSKRFRTYREIIAFYAVQACTLHKDYIGAYTLIREYMIFPYQNTNSFPWNILNYVSYFIEQQRRNKFSSRYIRRLLEKDASSPLRLFLAGNLLSSGFYKVSLLEFMTSLSYYNDNADLIECQLINLSISICFLQMINYRFSSQSDNRDAYVTNCLAYCFKYFLKRKSAYEAEAYYNLGRCYHQLNYLNDAVAMYNLVLNLSRCHSDSSLPDMKFQAAFNLCLIYKQTNRQCLTREIRDKFMSI